MSDTVNWKINLSICSFTKWKELYCQGLEKQRLIKHRPSLQMVNRKKEACRNISALDIHRINGMCGNVQEGVRSQI